MVTYRATINSWHTPEAVFDYLARFSNARAWDPGVIEAEAADRGPVGEGSRFHLVSRFLGARVALTYEVVDIERPRRVVLRADNGGFASVDTITVEAADRGSVVTYEATLRFRGPSRLLAPLFHLVFNRVGRKAAAGLKDHLNRDLLSS